jgi:hypothetical protein
LRHRGVLTGKIWLGCFALSAAWTLPNAAPLYRARGRFTEPAKYSRACDPAWCLWRHNKY